MFFVSPAYAKAVGGGGSEALIQFAPFGLVMLIMYLMFLRKKQKCVNNNMVNNISGGDQVDITNPNIRRVMFLIAKWLIPLVPAYTIS